MAEIKDNLRIQGISVEEINQSLGRIQDRLDALEGYRGFPDFKANPKLPVTESITLATAQAIQHYSESDFTEDNQFGVMKDSSENKVRLAVRIDGKMYSIELE